MTEAVVVHTDLAESAAAGTQLGAEIARGLRGMAPDAVVLFVSPQYDYTALLDGLDGACPPRELVGCSSSGEFTSGVHGVGMACAVALRSSTMRFTAAIGRHIAADHAAAVEELAGSFGGMHTHEYPYRSALVLTDALAGHADDLIDRLTTRTAGTYQFFGGGAGDDARFRQTHVFRGMEVATDAVVALEILSHHPVGVGVGHGWQPASPPLRVTAAEGMRLISLNAMPAAEVLAEHAARTGQTFDRGDPLPFFLHNVLGIQTGGGQKLRVPLAVGDDGALVCAAEVPVGAIVHIMGSTSHATVQAAATATRSALRQLDGQQPCVTLFFDCVATRLRMGQEFGFELQAVEQALGAGRYAGFNTFGQFARAEGQFSGFHNCTAVACIIPA
ncbi:MAG: FIST N-terminal domain-containing protein [Chloroflexota bacterium]